MNRRGSHGYIRGRLFQLEEMASAKEIQNNRKENGGQGEMFANEVRDVGSLGYSHDFDIYLKFDSHLMRMVKVLKFYCI